MSTKKKAKKLQAKNAELKKSVSELKKQLGKAEKRLAKSGDKAKRWRDEAQSANKSATRAKAKVVVLRAELAKAARPADQVEPQWPAQPEAPIAEAALESVDEQVAVETERSDQPDETWTVAELREEARSRELTGVSNLRKAELIEALRRS